MRSASAHIPAEQALAACASQRRGRGFTIIELIVSITIVALLVAILAVALSAALRQSRAATDGAAIRGIAIAVQNFDQQFGFLPPLIDDGEPLRTTMNAPVDTTGTRPTPVVLLAANDPTGDLFTYRRPRGFLTFPASNPWRDPRYSKFSLAYYLAGALPAAVDGVEGGGFIEPTSTGGFKAGGTVFGRGGQRFEPFQAVDRSGVTLRSEYVEYDEWAEHGRTLSGDPLNQPGIATTRAYRTAMVDRHGKAIRYYRWQPESLEAAGRRSADLNIPPVLVRPTVFAELVKDPANALVDLTEGNPALAEARWAVVAAGPDGLFGTEDIEDIALALGESAPMSPSVSEQAAMRERVWADNIVEYGP